MLEFKRFLVPFDFSKGSRLALECAIQLAKKESAAKIHLLHVLPPVHAIDYPGALAKNMETLVKRQEERAQADLEEWRKMIPVHFASESIIRRGHTGVCIVKTCCEKRIDLVVMTTHGRRGVKRLTHPNLSEKIVRLAPCAVIVLHSKQQAIKVHVEQRRAA